VEEKKGVKKRGGGLVGKKEVGGKRTRFDMRTPKNTAHQRKKKKKRKATRKSDVPIEKGGGGEEKNKVRSFG